MTISLAQYWMGRDSKHPGELSVLVRLNATELLERVNVLLEKAAAEGVAPVENEHGSPVASGWRPAAVNEATSNAAKASKHLSAEAIDLRDGPGRALARWCLRNLDLLDELELWMEDPQWTPSWVHLQMVPPGSGKRVYRPTSASALAAALIEQGGTA